MRALHWDNIAPSVKFARLLVGKNFFNNRLQSGSRGFIPLRGINPFYRLHYSLSVVHQSAFS